MCYRGRGRSAVQNETLVAHVFPSRSQAAPARVLSSQAGEEEWYAIQAPLDLLSRKACEDVLNWLRIFS